MRFAPMKKGMWNERKEGKNEAEEKKVKSETLLKKNLKNE